MLEDMKNLDQVLSQQTLAFGSQVGDLRPVESRHREGAGKNSKAQDEPIEKAYVLS